MRQEHAKKPPRRRKKTIGRKMREALGHWREKQVLMEVSGHEPLMLPGAGPRPQSTWGKHKHQPFPWFQHHPPL